MVKVTHKLGGWESYGTERHGSTYLNPEEALFLLVLVNKTTYYYLMKTTSFIYIFTEQAATYLWRKFCQYSTSISASSQWKAMHHRSVSCLRSFEPVRIPTTSQNTTA